MWNKRSKFLHVRVRVREAGKKGLGIWTPPIALYVLYYALLALEPILALLPKEIGGFRPQGAFDALAMALLGVMNEAPTDYVDVDVNGDKSQVRVLVRTC